MKNTLKLSALILSLTLTTATTAIAYNDTDACKDAASIFETVAELRDLGIDYSVVYDKMLKSGVDGATALKVIEFVYLTTRTLDPSTINSLSFSACMSGEEV